MGRGGRLFVLDSGIWNEWPGSPVTGAIDLAVGAQDELWVLSGTATSRSWDGAQWRAAVPTAGHGDLMAIWATADGDVWAVGEFGAVVAVEGKPGR